MELQTKIRIPTHPAPISYESQVLLWGSCFSTHMGEKFEQAQFKSLSNPFGVMFNPLAIAPLFERIASNALFTEADIFESHGRWHSYAFHSQMSRDSLQATLDAANAALQSSRAFLKQSTHLILSLGTAWGYELVDATKTTHWVANCHKQPAHLFQKKLASHKEVIAALQRIQGAALKMNPDLQLVCTVSPVRHIKDGLQENSQSKARLISAVHDFIEGYSTEKSDVTVSNVSYFPAFEIQMDELRDYRFYKPDMAHPSDQAVAYIWSQFTRHAMTQDCLTLMERIEKIQRDINHRPFQENSPAHQAFKAKLEAEILAIQAQYSWMFPG